MKWHLLIGCILLAGALLANRGDLYLKRVQDFHPLIAKGCQAYFAGNPVEAGAFFADAMQHFDQNQNDTLLAVANMAYSICLTREERQPEAVSYLKAAYRLSKQAWEPFTYHVSLEALAQIHSIGGEYFKAIYYRQELLAFTKAKGRRKLYENNLRTLANLYIRISMPDSAVVCLNEAVRSAVAGNDHVSLAKSHGTMSLYYRAINDFEKALHYRMLQLQYLENLNQDSRYLANARLQVARIFLLTNHYEQATDYARKALQICRELGLDKLEEEALSILQKAEAESDAQTLKQADSLSPISQMKANIRNIQQHRTPELVKALLEMGQALQDNRQYSRADSCYREALYLLENHQDKTYRYPQVLYQLGTLMLEIKEVGEAEKTFIRASREAFSFGELQVYQKANKLLAEVYHQKEQYFLGFQHLQIAYSVKDSLFSIEKEQLIQETEARYQLAQKKKELAELNLENEKNSRDLLLSRKKEQLAGMSVLVLIGTLFFILQLYRQKKENHRQLEFANADLAQSLDEKEFLLKEIHHRVKNNLQIISSMLSLQSDQVADPKIRGAMREGQNRVESMVLIHEHLYQSDNLQLIDAQAYLSRLTESLYRSYRVDPNRIRLINRIEPIPVKTDLAITLGLIMNELISNALKYAFPDGRDGRLEVSLRRSGDGFELGVKDNGIGLPQSVLKGSRSTLGFQLIQAFTRKLKASIDIQNDRGTKVILNIPKITFQTP